MLASLPILAPKVCGECHACCTWLPIPAGQVQSTDKPAGQSCPHLGPLGCGIYEHRPEMCSSFRCAYLADDSWPEAWRPDRCRLLVLRETIDPQVRAAAVYETAPGALASSVAQELLEQLRITCAVVVTVELTGRRSVLLGQRRIDPAAAPPSPSSRLLSAWRQANGEPDTAPAVPAENCPAPPG